MMKMNEVTELVQMKTPVCTVSYKWQWMGQNISFLENKNTSLTQLTIVHILLFTCFILVCVRSWWMFRYQ